LVTVTPDEVFIEQVDMQYSRPLRLAYLPREICGPDEALLTFLQRVRAHGSYPPLHITHMDIVYFQVESGVAPPGTVLYAEPFYRIFIQGQDEPFLINAFTNQMH